MRTNKNDVNKDQKDKENEGNENDCAGAGGLSGS